MLDEPDEPDEVLRKREELYARRTKVMFLRNAGATWGTIATETGVSEATARKDYAVVCRDINAEQPANVVARHRAVIFDIQRANYPAMMAGDKDAAATVLKALDREAKLLGLDAPTKIMAAVSGEEFANEAARLIAKITALDPTTLKELERVQRRNDPTNVIDGSVEPDGATAPATGQLAHPAAPAGAVDDDPEAVPEPGGRDEGAEGVRGPGSGESDGRPGVAPFDIADWSNIDDD
jgi:hypothetical protein